MWKYIVAFVAFAGLALWMLAGLAILSRAAL